MGLRASFCSEHCIELHVCIYDIYTSPYTKEDMKVCFNLYCVSALSDRNMPSLGGCLAGWTATVGASISIIVT